MPPKKVVLPQKTKKRLSFKFLAGFLFVGVLSAFLVRIFVEKDSIPLQNSMSVANSSAPKYWGVCIWQWNSNGNLRTMNRVFERLNFDFVDALKGDDWDVLWSIEYPYSEDRRKYFEPVYSLKPHQRINHFPGLIYMTSKFYMNVHNQDFEFILKSFKFPQDRERFEAFAAANPNRTLVQKNLDNRGVKIVKLEEVDFDVDSLFYQEFMHKPFLIDDRAFDVGIFVLISSIDPLRVYRYDNEILMRFCPEPYYPFNASNTKQYVVDDLHKHFFEMPSLNHLHEKFGYSFKQIFADHLRRRGHSFQALQAKFDSIIRRLILRLEPTFVEQTFQVYNTSHHFFEIVRFDFILDEALNVYLMEVNSSPNLTPMFKRFENNSASNEQIVHNVLRLVGASSELDLKSRYNPDADKMLSSLKNIAVDIHKCVDNGCDKNCSQPACQLCTSCLDELNLENLHRSYREHIRRGGFKRLFPAQGDFGEEFIKQLSPKNQISARWFKSKCERKADWC